MSENVKKYFIKDSELTSEEQDKLNSKDIVKNISLIIDNTKPPFSIALTGKSGIGKSSIVNLVSEHYQDKSDYNIKKINVWKDEEISLKDVITGSTNSRIEEVNSTNVGNEKVSEDASNGSSSTNAKKQKVIKTILKVAKYVGVFLICLLIPNI